MNKEQEDWKKKCRKWLAHSEEYTIESNVKYIEETFIQPLQKDRDEYKALYESAIKKGQELIQENASLQNQNTLLQEDNFAMSKAMSERIIQDKLNELM